MGDDRAGEVPRGGPRGLPRWAASLRFKLVLLVILAMGPALAVVVHGGLQRRGEALERAGQESLTTARTAARLEEAVFDDARQFLNAVALQPEVKHLAPGPKRAAFTITPRGEREPAVAAASFLARAAFLEGFERLRADAGGLLPYGASDPRIVPIARGLVREGGREWLGKFAKLHFKTTQAVLGGTA